MASWAGTSRVTIRRQTFRIDSAPGIMKNSPGPRAPISRPSRKITPRSYSWTIFTAAVKIMNNKIATTARPMSCGMRPPLVTVFKPIQQDALDNSERGEVCEQRRTAVADEWERDARDGQARQVGAQVGHRGEENHGRHAKSQQAAEVVARHVRGASYAK